MAPASYPALISAPRVTTLLASTLVSLSSGSNYAFSVWGPQLGARLGLSHTQLNVIALSSIVGAYSSGPIWGRIVDARGPRILLAGGAVFFLSGYLGVWNFFEAGLLPSGTTLATLHFLALIACKFGMGVASCAGHLSSVNTTAKTFPDSARGTTTGMVISAHGLSAFVFSTIARSLFPGDTSSFLLLLAFGTAIPMILGLFLVRPIPLPPSESHAAYLHSAQGESTVSFRHEDESRTPLLAEDLDESDELEGYQSTTRELSRSRSRGSVESAKEYHNGQPNIHGLTLLKTPEFWLSYSLFSMLGGTGIAYINNVGTMSQALYAHTHPVFNDKEAQKWQAVQVSTISVANFVGRVITGFASDFTKTRLQWPRSYGLVLISLVLLTSQYVVTRIDDPQNLWIASALLGLGYGSTAALFPSMCIEWFGLSHFSENWGYISTSFLISGNLFSLAFGRSLDAHVPPAHQAVPAGRNGRMCLEGQACYVDGLYLTMSACALCVGLSIYAAWRDQKKLVKFESWGRRRTSEP